MDTHSQPGEIHFRIGSVPVTIQPYFWLVTIILAGPDFQKEPRPWPIFTWVLACLISIILHELGHVWMWKLFGGENCRILLYGMGGLAFSDREAPKRWQRILISLAGPGIQLLLFAFLIFTLSIFSLPDDRPLLPIFLDQMLYINFFWAIINLTPIYPLDGGHVANEIFGALFKKNGVTISAYVSILLACLIGYYVVVSQQSIFNLIILGFLVMANVERLQREAARRHYDSDSDWRE